MSPLRKLRHDRRGAVAMILALATPMLVGGMGFGIDTIQWTLAKRSLQRQADSGAIAGAYALAQGASVSTSVNSDLARNQTLPLSTTVIENAPTAGPHAGKARSGTAFADHLLGLSGPGGGIDHGITVHRRDRHARGGTAGMERRGQYPPCRIGQGNRFGPQRRDL